MKDGRERKRRLNEINNKPTLNFFGKMRKKYGNKEKKKEYEKQCRKKKKMRTVLKVRRKEKKGGRELN